MDLSQNMKLYRPASEPKVVEYFDSLTYACILKKNCYESKFKSNLLS